MKPSENLPEQVEVLIVGAAILQLWRDAMGDSYE